MDASQPQQIFYNFLGVEYQPAKFIIDDLYFRTSGVLVKGLDGLSESLKSANREPAPNDRISRLPDEIRVLILSFLTTEEATRTCVLSTQWLTLWMHTSRLDFNAKISPFDRSLNAGVAKEQASKFLARVNRILQFHRAPALDEFRICFDLARDSQEVIDMWIDYAFAKRVQRFELDSLGSTEYGLPLSFNPPIFTENHLNSCIDFHSLKELSLKGVDVTGKFIKYLLRNCCFLERLTVVGSTTFDKVVVSSSSLKYLDIMCPDCIGSLRICSPNLRTLKLQNPTEMVLTNISALTEVHVYGPLGFPLSEGLVSCLSQIEVLMLQSENQEELEDVLPESFVLNKVKVLIINIGAWGDEILIGLTSFLTACPNLQKFQLQLFWMQPRRTKRKLVKAAKCPLNLKHFKEVEVSGYYGRASEVELITYLLENADALEKIIIDPRNTTSVVHAPRFYDIEEEKTARICAREQLQKLVPRHVELIILES